MGIQVAYPNTLDIGIFDEDEGVDGRREKFDKVRKEG